MLPGGIQLGEASGEFETISGDPDSPPSRHTMMVEGDELEEEAPSVRGALPRILTSIAWVLLFLVVSVYRACTSP